MLFDDFKIISKKMSNKNRLFNRKKDTDYWGFRFYWHKFFKILFLFIKKLKNKISNHSY